MYRKIALITLLAPSYILFAKPPPPPVLKRSQANVCWNNAALQLLRNIKPITIELVADKKRPKNNQKHYNQGNKLADAYIDFLHATFENDQKKIDDSLDFLYGLICERKGVSIGSVSILNTTIKTIAEVFKDLFNKHTSMDFTYYINRMGKLTKQSRSLTGPHVDSMPDIINNFVRFSPNQLLMLPEYLIAYVDISGGPYPLEDYYELIGLIDGWKIDNGISKKGIQSYAPGGHFWAYIKDEFNSDHLWYVRNDLNLNQKDPIVWPTNITCAARGLYKRRTDVIEKLFEKAIETRIDTLGKAFADIF